MPPVEKLIPVLQTAIGPMILISGVGLLLITMTNRLGRTVDRIREQAGADPAHRIQAQLDILWHRSRLLRTAILFSSVSALCAAFLIILLFLTALYGLETSGIIGGLFIACMTSLIVALIVFIRDVNQSLTAVRLELDR